MHGRQNDYLTRMSSSCVINITSLQPQLLPSLLPHTITASYRCSNMMTINFYITSPYIFKREYIWSKPWTWVSTLFILVDTNIPNTLSWHVAS
ncbi:hypothetical protein L210DRAFT_394835 [Boletus edulis BED1]|uniref:Uncharacterized protein n=1 Tax=Boletus edulis BED1 TaxID=1328754 RepID=A0AAD4BX11_BOLED|nr:hypothetical protein L210DRAFT_394835 [Boletus edulis BED1]